jgi:hypothetical protein
VTLSATLAQRAATWCIALDQHGYEIVLAPKIDLSIGFLGLRARRLEIYGGPTTTIDAVELLQAGRDPDALAPELDGHHIRRASWHAQIGTDGDTEAERLDIDRRKPGPLARHRHPYGSPNEVREATLIATPAAWLVHVETILAQA